MSEHFATPARVGRPARAAALALALLAAALATRTTITSLDWVGRPFPGFLLIEDRVVAAIGLPHWPSIDVPDLYLQQVRAVDDVAVADGEAVYGAAAARPPGSVLRYTLVRGGHERQVALPTIVFTAGDWGWLFGAYLLNGVVFMATGLLAWALRPGSPLTRAFLAFAASWSVFLLTAMDLYRPATFLHLYLLANTAIWASGWQLAMLFPEPHRLARWRFAGYPLALLTFAAYEWTLRTPDRSTAVFAASSTALGMVALFFGARLVLAYRSGSALVRQRVRLVTLGTVVGLSVPGLLTLATVVLRGAVAQNVLLFAVPLFPLALGYAIARHDFFALDAMVKRGATYLLLTGAVGASYALAVFLFDRLLRGVGGAAAPAFPLFFTLAILLLFNPLRTRLQAIVDRVFFRTRYDGAEVLADVTDRLAAARRAGDIDALVRASVDAAIPTTTGSVVLRCDPRGGGFEPLAVDDPDARALRAELDAERVRTVFDAAESFASPAHADAVRRALQRLAIEIAVPMRVRGETRGALGLGPKRSGLFFTAGDVEFLRALAQSAAIAFDNAAAYEHLEALNRELEARVADQATRLVQAEHLATLGRLAAGVAHEINNPVSFIAGSIAPLRERLATVAAHVPPDAREALDDAAELVGVMARGAQRTATIVADLRSFSRVNEARRKVVDLHDGLDVTLRLLEPRWSGRIAIARDYGTLPPIECEPGQLNQVFMNLLANACDAIADRGTIRVATAVRDGVAEIVVADDGCGIPPDRLPRIFDPFFTTKEVGKGTGLGLAIAHGIVASHGGAIAVESTVGVGTTFRVTLPLTAAPAAAAG